jgi:mRNA-degrading endonuclease RelE of RelBE toxin-antitoxin system
MYNVAYKPSFVRQLKKLDQKVLELVLIRINLLKDNPNHNLLKVHKLHGGLDDFHSFFVSSKLRIIFKFESKKEIVLYMIGSHDIYK